MEKKSIEQIIQMPPAARDSYFDALPKAQAKTVMVEILATTLASWPEAAIERFMDALPKPIRRPKHKRAYRASVGGARRRPGKGYGTR